MEIHEFDNQANTCSANFRKLIIVKTIVCVEKIYFFYFFKIHVLVILLYILESSISDKTLGFRLF